MLATINLVIRKLYELTVIPVPPKDRTEVGWKLLPLTAKLVILSPSVPSVWEIDIITGGNGVIVIAWLANGPKFTWKLTLSPVPGPAPDGPVAAPQKLFVASTSGVNEHVPSFGQSAFQTPQVELP